jgi:protein gp37
MTGIQWTERTITPIVGCSLVSPGGSLCYAMKQAAALIDKPDSVAPWYIGTTIRVNGKAVWSGKIARAPDAKFYEPLRRRKPTLYFTNSMGDLFHEDAPREWLDEFFGEVMERCPQHRFQILTKRRERMRDYMHERYAGREPPGHIWLGVSVEDQRRADERLPVLLEMPAAIRWVSVELLLEPVDLRPWLSGLDWIVMGGESRERGGHARLFDIAWARDVLRQFREAFVQCFVKQMGSNPIEAGKPIKLAVHKCGDINEWPLDLNVREWPTT